MTVAEIQKYIHNSQKEIKIKQDKEYNKLCKILLDVENMLDQLDKQEEHSKDNNTAYRDGVRF